MKRSLIIIAVIGLLCPKSVIMAQDYVGSNKCKGCHSSSKKGAQYKVWAASSHANAFETLKSEEAEKIAKEKGIKVPASEAPECLVCHTTGFGKGGYEVKGEDFWNYASDDKKAKKAAKRMAGLQAVGCEVCHGPGSDYKKKKTMEAIFNGELDGSSVGLSIPNEELCITCHNSDSPFYKSFNFEEKVKKITHSYPADMEK